ncbi:hypothetical protein AHF37_10234 [Paragonimus kellicotti]|nr:hypothetical protein AHF37_10234 [Paragonimus kellicotti]
MSTVRNWKAEIAEKRRQRERETDVEKRWQEVMDKNGEGAPEWLKEAAMRKKKAQKPDDGLVPWMKEYIRRSRQPRNYCFAKKKQITDNFTEFSATVIRLLA